MYLIIICRLREKYHPDFIDETREQISKSIRHRLDVFLDLFDKGLIENQPVEMENSKNLTKLMDAVIVKLNGGNDDDLILLDKVETMEGEERSVKERVGLVICIFVIFIGVFWLISSHNFSDLAWKAVREVKVKSQTFTLMMTIIWASPQNRVVLN